MISTKHGVESGRIVALLGVHGRFGCLEVGMAWKLQTLLLFARMATLLGAGQVFRLRPTDHILCLEGFAGGILLVGAWMTIFSELDEIAMIF